MDIVPLGRKNVKFLMCGRDFIKDIKIKGKIKGLRNSYIGVI